MNPLILFLMYALILSDNIFTSSFLSRGLKYENIHSLPFSFHHFDPQTINMSEFDCAVIKIEKESSYILEILNLLPNKPTYLIKPKDIKLPINRKNLIVTENNATIRQIAYDMKKRINGNVRNNKESFIRVADLSLNLSKRIALRFNKTITLRNKEFHLLEFLMCNSGVIFSRQNLLEKVWDRNTNMFTNTIDVHINLIRQKLDYKEGFRLIETIHCHGYVMHPKPFG